MKSQANPFVWPGHLIRRLQQTAVLAFHRNTAGFRLTPTQFVTLLAIEDAAGVDQVRVSQVTMIDRSMTARIVETLVRRGLIRKQPSKIDKRSNALFIAQKGTQLLAAVRPYVKKSQQEILDPLNAADRADFIRMVSAILSAAEAAGEVGLDEEEEAVRPAKKRRVRKP